MISDFNSLPESERKEKFNETHEKMMHHEHNKDAHHYHHVKHGGKRTDAYDAAGTAYDKSKTEEINSRPFKK